MASRIASNVPSRVASNVAEGRRDRRVASAFFAVVASAVSAIAISGCATSSQATPAATLGASVSPTAAPTPTKGALTKHSATNRSIPAPKESPVKPTVKVSRPTDPLAPKSPVKVIRGGKVAKPTVKANAQLIGKPVTYRDGLEVEIMKIKQSTVTAEGPGNLTGSPTTTITFELTNSTAKAIDLNQVVVTASYGSPSRIASAMYVPGSQDFNGTVKPGAKSVASYTASIPVADKCDVSISVDFDGLHSDATFTGAATAAAVRAHGSLRVC